MHGYASSIFISNNENMRFHHQCLGLLFFTVQFHAGTHEPRINPRLVETWKTFKSTRRELGHSLLRSLIRSHRSLIRLLRTARFARAFHYAHLLAHSLTPELMGKWLCLWNERVDFIRFQPTIQCFETRPVIKIDNPSKKSLTKWVSLSLLMSQDVVRTSRCLNFVSTMTFAAIIYENHFRCLNDINDIRKSLDRRLHMLRIEE